MGEERKRANDMRGNDHKRDCHNSGLTYRPNPSACSQSRWKQFSHSLNIINGPSTCLIKRFKRQGIQLPELHHRAEVGRTKVLERK
jgi:hypothetical protein